MSLINEALKKVEEKQTLKQHMVLGEKEFEEVAKPLSTPPKKKPMVPFLLMITPFLIVIIGLVVLLVMTSSRDKMKKLSPVSQHVLQQGETEMVIESDIDLAPQEESNELVSTLENEDNPLVQSLMHIANKMVSTGKEGEVDIMETIIADTLKKNTQIAENSVEQSGNNLKDLNIEAFEHNDHQVVKNEGMTPQDMINEYLDHSRITGVIVSGDNSKVLMNNNVLTVNSILRVNSETELIVTQVTPHEIELVDDSGFKYRKEL